MKAEAIRYIGKVLPDGHLSLPEEAAHQIGIVFDVVLLPVNSQNIYDFAESLAGEKGFSSFSDSDIEDVIHKSRDVC